MLQRRPKLKRQRKLLTPTAAGDSSNEEGNNLDASLSYSVSSKKGGMAGGEEYDGEADKLLQNFMNEDQVFNKYLFECAKELPDEAGARIIIGLVIASFDPVKYYKKKGSQDYPSIFLMARIQFSWMDNSGFQERVSPQEATQCQRAR